MSRFLPYAFTCAFAFVIAGICFAESPEDPTPVEIGSVEWNRDLVAAKKASADSGKPLLLFFQEVPG